VLARSLESQEKKKEYFCEGTMLVITENSTVIFNEDIDEAELMEDRINELHEMGFLLL